MARRGVTGSPAGAHYPGMTIIVLLIASAVALVCLGRLSKGDHAEPSLMREFAAWKTFAVTVAAERRQAEARVAELFEEVKALRASGRSYR